jgi:peptide/nickel transport system ATP-binding protein
LLEIDRLSVAFRDRDVVRDLSLAIEPGEVLGLVGESGSGKSVSALATMRLLDPSAEIRGSIRLCGEDLMACPPPVMRRYRGAKIAMIFQEPMTALNPVMRVGKQIAEALQAHQSGLGHRQVTQAVIDAMHSVAIPEPERRMRDYPHQFSGGQRQRILIAMALINRPQLLIADEPTTALDVTVQAQILGLLKSLQRQFGLAMLFISHDLAVVAQVAEKIAVMRNGLLLEKGTRDQVFLSPAHAYTRALLSAVPTLKTERDHPLASVPSGDLLHQGNLVECAPGHWTRVED